MNRLRAGILLVSAALWVWTSWLWAEADPARITWLGGQGSVVHWDNVEGAPDWLDGPVPHYSHNRRMHLVALQPGESVRIRVPAREQLRLVSAAAALHPGDVDVEWSNGSGLFVTIPLRLSKDDGSLLTDAGDARTAGIMRVTRPAKFEIPVSVALFRSRHTVPASVVSYRTDVDIPGLRRVRLADYSGTHPYRMLPGGDSVTLPVQGGMRYRLETRAIFPAAGGASQQSYRIDAVLDGKPWQVFEFETSLDSRDPVAVDGCYTPLGRRVRGYLKIPDGARQLELRSTAPVYLRLLGQSSGDDYLWSGNRPLQYAAMQQGGTVTGSIWDLSTTQVRDAIETAESAALPEPQLLQRLLQDNRWRDGGLIGSALARRGQHRYVDNAALRQQAERARLLHTRYRDLLPVTVNVTAAQQFAWFRTPVLRDTPGHLIVPETYAETLASQLAGGYFLEVPAGSQRHHEYALPVRAAASQLRVSIARNSVSTATRLFLQFDDAPPRQLRVMAAPDLPAALSQPGRAEAALTVLDHTHGAQGQSLAGPFAARHDAAALLDADFIELPLPRDAQRVRVWRDPEQGAPVRLALQYRGSRPYRLSGAGYQALLQALGTEAVFQQLRAALTRGSQGIADFQTDSGSAGAGPVSWQDNRVHDLYNQWLPLLRLLHARHDRLAAAVQAGQGATPAGAQLAAAERRALQEAAAQAAASGDRVAALETWTAVWHGTTGKLRDEAALARVSLLEQLGESYLADQQLRSLLLDGASETTRAQALDRLLARYRRAGNDEAVLNVLAVAVVHHPKPAYLRALADSLLALGKTHAALQVALALPAAEQPRQLLLEASYAAGWWTVFEAQLELGRDTPAYHRWAGLQAQAFGDYTQALAHWEQGDALTASLRQQLLEGLDIRTQLAAADAGVRRQAVLNWEQWQSRHPGPVNWQAAPQLVTRYAGAETLYNPGQDQSSIAFRATPDAAVRLQVQGPVTLRLTARGLHAQATAAALDDWVRVTDGTRHTLFPVTDNRPAQGLQLSGVERPLPGLAEIFEYRVAPGPHELRITPQRGPLLLQVAAARPRLPLAVLPPLTAATVQAALQGRLGVAQDGPSAPARGVAVDVLRQCGMLRLFTTDAGHDTVLAEPLPATGSAAGQSYTSHYHTVSSDETLYSIARRYATTAPELARLNAIAAPYIINAGQRLRIAPATTVGVSDAGKADYVVRQGDTLYSIASRHATTVAELARLNTLAAPYNLRPGQRLHVRVAAPDSADTVVIRQPITVPGASTGVHAYVVKSGDTLYSIAAQSGFSYRQLAALNAIRPPYNIHAGQRLQLGTATGTRLAAVARGTDSQVVEQMREILWLAEHDDRQVTAMVAQGEALFQQHPDVPVMQRLLRRLRRATAWELVSTVQASAGVRVVEVPAGLSEYPATRIRKALLPGLRSGEQLLSGFETLVFAVDQPTRAYFHIDLTLEELTAVPAVPMQARLQLDDGPERTLLLTPAQPGQSLIQAVPPGKHLLRVRISEPVLNQFLRVFIKEQGGHSEHLQTTRSGQRSYHVATRDEPVIVSLEGPTRLRIDELREGQIQYRYQNLAAGWQQVQLEAGPHQEQALFRIYRLTSRQPSVPVPARLPAVTPYAVPLPAASLSADSSPVQRETIDRFSLGGQEDGTWSLASALVRRRNLDEDNAGDDQAEDFAELRATHRFFSADKQSYFRTDLLTRVRDEGGPTLGVRSWADIRRPDWPVEIALSGTLYTQRPDDETGSEWAATVRGALSHRFDITPRTAHKPVISVFQRWLSLDENLQQHPERVDQDIFTEYKNDHRRGLGIADMLTYRPWLDTLWYGSLGVVSNENLNVLDPDHVVVALGARQLMNNWQASAEYQARQYFPDQDRDQSVQQHRYQLSLDWLGWRSYKHGWKGRMQLIWDDSSKEFSGFLSIAWVHSNARFYRDFRPAERGFRSLRERQLQEQFFTTSAGGPDDR